MKHIIDKAEKAALAAICSESAQALLKHVLSPIEKAAFKRSFQPFRYTLKGAKIYVNGHSSRKLLHGIMQKVEHLTFLVTKEQKSRNIPLRLREVFDDPAEILGLPASTRNHLCSIECYTMYTAMQLGRDFFLNRPGFGKRSLASLEALFAKHSAQQLFK